MGRRFTEQVVWITGASSGIGRELALAFAREGAHLALSARRVDKLEGVQKEIEALGRKAICVPCDVTDDAAVQAAVARVVADLGRLDVAVANAGFGVMGAVAKLSVDDWRRQFDTNVFGAVSTARHALPELIKNRGRMVFIASVAAFAPLPTGGPYGASKAALRMIGQTLSIELHGSGASCTTVHPGFVESEIARVDNQGHHHPGRRDIRPQALMWPTDKAARVIVGAAYKRRREFVFTAHGKLGAFIGQHFPSFVGFVLSRLKPKTPDKQ